MLNQECWVFSLKCLNIHHCQMHHMWKRCTSGLWFFKRMKEDQHCHQHSRWLCGLWLCSGCWSMRMNDPLYFHCSVFQVASFELSLEHVSNSTWRPHWNQQVARGCGWEQNVVKGPGCPTSSTGARNLRSRSFSFQHAEQAAPPAPPRECWDASALASMQVVWPAGPGQPRAEQSTPAVLSPPRGRAPVRPEIASPPLSTPAPRKPSSELSTN